MLLEATSVIYSFHKSIGNTAQPRWIFKNEDIQNWIGTTNHTAPWKLFEIVKSVFEEPILLLPYLRNDTETERSFRFERVKS